MNTLFVNWIGEKPMEKIFTSLRIVLWTNVLSKLVQSSNKAFLFMFEHEENQTFIDCFKSLELIQNGEKYFLERISNEQQEMMKNRLNASSFISFDDDERMIVNIEHVEKDYLLKSSKESSIRVPEDPRLFDKFYSFEKAIQSLSMDDLTIIHCCDFQSQYQCELFVVLSKILFSNYSHVKQRFLILAPAVIGDDRPSVKYDEFSVENYIKEVLAKIVNERATASPEIAMAIFKLQLMCRKQSSIVRLLSNLETNHDALFLLYTGARLISILNNYEDKFRNGIYPVREVFHEQLANQLMTKDEQAFLQWIDSFESRYLNISLNDSDRIQINLDRIFQEYILFCRRLSPYYSKVRILTENQNHLLSIMFARLELIERIVSQLRRIFLLIDIPFIERM